MKNIIAFDVDNVVCNFHQLLDNYLKVRYGMSYNPIEYYAPLPPGSTQEEFNDEVNSLILTGSQNLKPITTSIKYLKKFYKFTERPLHFITARHPRNKKVTEHYLSKWLGKDIEFYVDFPEEHIKEPYLVGHDYFVDDKPGNIIPALNDGIIKVGFLYDQPWNQNCSEIPAKLIRIKNLKEVWTYVRTNCEQ